MMYLSLKDGKISVANQGLCSGRDSSVIQER